MNNELTKMIEDASRLVARGFRKHQDVIPQYHALAGDGEWFSFATPAKNAHEKDINAMMVRALFADRSVQRYIYVAEIWTCDWEGDENDAHSGSLEFHPRRKEAVVFIAEDRLCGSVLGLRYIDRTGRRPKLKPLEIHSGGEMAGGRFASMLTPMNAAQVMH
jgi:hypothetical protein